MNKTTNEKLAKLANAYNATFSEERKIKMEYDAKIKELANRRNQIYKEYKEIERR